MALGDAYADAATYRALIRRNDNADDVAILDDLTAVSRYLDRKLGRFFTNDTAVVARTYDPPRRGRTLWVHDIAVNTGVVVKVDTNQDGSFADETAFVSTDYQLWPPDAEKDPEPSPWTALVLPEWTTQAEWRPGVTVQVTARFGWPAIPKAIARATCQLTAIFRLETPRALSGVGQDVESVLDVAPDGQRIVAQLSNAYDRRRFGVPA